MLKRAKAVIFLACRLTLSGLANNITCRLAPAGFAIRRSSGWIANPAGAEVILSRPLKKK
jgi:hypothetical protein